jgi:hypothetical protein
MLLTRGARSLTLPSIHYGLQMRSYGLPILVTPVQGVQHAFPPYVRPFIQNRGIAAFESLLFQAGKEGFRVLTAGELEHDVCIVPLKLGQLPNDRPLALQSVSQV